MKEQIYAENYLDNMSIWFSQENGSIPILYIEAFSHDAWKDLLSDQEMALAQEQKPWIFDQYRNPATELKNTKIPPGFDKVRAGWESNSMPASALEYILRSINPSVEAVNIPQAPIRKGLFQKIFNMDSDATRLNLEIALKGGKNIEANLSYGESRETLMLWMTPDGDNNQAIKDIGLGWVQRYGQTHDGIQVDMGHITGISDIIPKNSKAMSMGQR